MWKIMLFYQLKKFLILKFLHCFKLDPTKLSSFHMVTGYYIYSPFNLSLQSVPSIRPLNLSLQPVPSICPFNLSLQSVPSICHFNLSFNLFLQSVPSICPFNLSLQSVPSTCPFNLSLQSVLVTKFIEIYYASNPI